MRWGEELEDEGHKRVSIERHCRPPTRSRRRPPNSVAIGERIRTGRLAQGMTLRSIAAAANLSPSMLSLSSVAEPRLDRMPVVIANCLKVVMSDLVAPGLPANPGVVVRVADRQIVETGNHVIRRIIRKTAARCVDRDKRIPTQYRESDQPVPHDGHEYGFVLEGY